MDCMIHSCQSWGSLWSFLCKQSNCVTKIMRVRPLLCQHPSISLRLAKWLLWKDWTGRLDQKKLQFNSVKTGESSLVSTSIGISIKWYSVQTPPNLGIQPQHKVPNQNSKKTVINIKWVRLPPQSGPNLAMGQPSSSLRKYYFPKHLIKG